MTKPAKSEITLIDNTANVASNGGDVECNVEEMSGGFQLVTRVGLRTDVTFADVPAAEGAAA